MIVVDASLVLASLFEDERTPPVVSTMESIGDAGGIVPSLWYLEVANGLQIAVRRKRIDVAFRNAALAKIALLPIQMDGETNLHAWHATLALADRYELTPYDAAYLELAQRRRLPLATLDKALASAALSAGVEIISLID